MSCAQKKKNTAIKYTVILVLYSEEATVPGSTAHVSLDNNDKRSSATDSKSTEAQRAKRTCEEQKINKISIQSDSDKKKKKHDSLTMTRGGLLDPLSSLFSFKTAALFWSRICKIPNQLLCKRQRNAQETVGTKKQWEIPFYFSEFELHERLCQHCALLLRLQVCLKNPTEKANYKKKKTNQRHGYEILTLDRGFMKIARRLGRETGLVSLIDLNSGPSHCGRTHR